MPVWAQGQTIYMHWFNDRNETAMNLVPDLTSTIQAYYEGRLYDGTVFDKSENLSAKILTAKVSGLIQGWQIALQQMHVGDTVQVVIPYQLAYGVSGSGSIRHPLLRGETLTGAPSAPLRHRKIPKIRQNHIKAVNTAKVWQDFCSIQLLSLGTLPTDNNFFCCSN